MESIEGRVAVVTGGTRGIGRAIVEALLAEGAAVALCGAKQAGIDQALRQLQPAERVFARVADVSNEEEVHRFISEVVGRFGTIDILINSAGVGAFALLAEITPAMWAELIGVNLTGVFYCCRAVLPILQASGCGDIVNVSSLAGSNAFAGGAGYNASKFGLNGLTEAMMLDYRNDGVRVSLVAPGSVDTGFGGRNPVGSEGGFGGRIAPADVADVVLGVLKMPGRTTVSRVEIRPSKPPGR